MVAPAARLGIELLRRNVYLFTWPALSKIDLVLNLVSHICTDSYRAFNHIFSTHFLTSRFRRFAPAISKSTETQQRSPSGSYRRLIQVKLLAITNPDLNGRRPLGREERARLSSIF